MNILLIGGTGSLMNQLIVKLKKEGHRVFLLTGEHYKKVTYEKVFEKYNFTYDSENLSDIFESVNPDATIFLGAYDTNFKWKSEEKDSVKFTSGLMNLLVAYSMVKRGKFLFLSSDEVFNGRSYDERIEEETETSAVGFKAMTLAQCERICENYRENWKLDIVVLRLAQVCHTPTNRSEVKDKIASMCLQALEEKTLMADETEKRSFLHELDAVEFIHRVAVSKEIKESLYHLSDGNTISELDLAHMIQNYLPETEIIENVSKGMNRSLCGNRFFQEFGVLPHKDLEGHIKKTALYMKKKQEAFLNEEEMNLPWWKRLLKKWAWLIRALIPFLENMICFIPFFMLNNRAVGSEYFSNLDFYLLYVLLFAIVYGQQQATFSAVLAVAGYFFRQTYGRSSFEVLMDYNTYVWIAQLFILGLVVGYMRDQITSIRKESRELEEHLSRQISDIRDINGSNVRVKDVLERQVIDQKDSVGKIYSITSTLDQYMPDEVLFYAVEMLTKLLGTEDVAIYSVVNDDYARMFSASSMKARELGNSVRYRELGEVYQDMMQRKVYINRKLDEKYPLMANAIFEEDNMKMIVMIWGIPWEKMTLAQANLLTVVSYLIQNAVLRANRYMSALEEQRYLEHTRILETNAFSSLVHAYQQAKRRNLTECTILQIDENGDSIQGIGEKIAKSLRQSDYLGKLEDGNLYALLANTTKEEALIVKERFLEKGIESRIVEKVAV